MKENDFFENMHNQMQPDSSTQNELFNKINNMQKSPRRRFIPKYASAFAALLIVSASVFGIYHFSKNPNTLPINTNSDTTTLSDTGALEGKTEGENNATSAALYYSTYDETGGYILKWNERTLLQKFPHFYYENNEYTLLNYDASPLDYSLTGEFIGEITAKNTDVYEDKEYTQKIKLYKIKGTGENAVCAGEYEDEQGKYYPFVNRDYSPETLGQFISDLNLREFMTLGGTAYSVSGKTAYEIDKQILFDEILDANLSAENFSYKYCGSAVLTISYKAEILGMKTYHAIVLSDEGYIWFAGPWSCSFKVGVDAINAFSDYLENNVQTVETLVATSFISDSGIPE